MNLWDSVKERAIQGANAAKLEVQKTKIRGEIFLIDREIKARQQAFGVDLYNFVAPLASGQDFFASDDKLTTTLRPPLLKAQREIAALDIKHKKIKTQIDLAVAKRQASFPTPATTFSEKVANAGKSTAMAGNEAKLATELAMVDTQIKAHKQDFGLELYHVLVDLEDQQGWLATDRNIRSMYDQTRKDVEIIQKRKTAKEKELVALGGGSSSTTTSATSAAQSKSLQATLNWSAATGSILHNNNHNNNNNNHANGGFVPPPPTAPPRATAVASASPPPPPPPSVAQGGVVRPPAYSAPQLARGSAPSSAPTPPPASNPMFSFPPPAAAAAAVTTAPPLSAPNVSATTDMFANTNFFDGQDPFASTSTAAPPSSSYSAPPMHATYDQNDDPFASFAAASAPFSSPPPPTSSSSHHQNGNPNQQQDLLDFL